MNQFIEFLTMEINQYNLQETEDLPVHQVQKDILEILDVLEIQLKEKLEISVNPSSLAAATAWKVF